MFTKHVYLSGRNVLLAFETRQSFKDYLVVGQHGNCIQRL